MEALRQQGTLTAHTFETDCKINLGIGEGVTKMQTTVHVGVWHTSHILWVCLVQVCIVGVLLNGRCIDLKGVCLVPKLSCWTFEGAQSIALSGLEAVRLSMYIILSC